MTLLPKLRQFVKRLLCKHAAGKTSIAGQEVGVLHIRFRCPKCKTVLKVRDLRELINKM